MKKVGIKMKKVSTVLVSAMLALVAFSGCAFGNGENGESSSSSSSKKPETPRFAEVIPTIYDVDEIVTADKTKAGNVEAWHAEVRDTPTIDKDAPKANSLIHSPWHTLKINDTDVPVYTARCANGPHSFAWVDVATFKKNFTLKVELTMSEDYGMCVVLPESRGVVAEKNEKTFTSYITEYASYTYTFAEEADAAYTDYKLAPLTIMVTEEADFDIPEGYEVVEIEPGFHDVDDLMFTEEERVYVMKAGFHDVCGIKLPSFSRLYIEKGAYLKYTERKNDKGKYNGYACISANDVEDVQIISRGLLDCGSLIGGDTYDGNKETTKHKGIVAFQRCENGLIDGVTVINSSNWTMGMSSCSDMEITRTLLLSYRTFSDGIMMSDCVDSVGRYNFVRTGDDSIEFKGTGWGRGGVEGSNCVYEYNDLWTDKGAGYCLTYENAYNMSNMIFRNNSVGFAIPTWTIRNAALDIRVGANPNTRWGDITFENIEIYHVVSPNVAQIYASNGGGIVDNILFKNISVHSTEPGVYAFRMLFDAAGGSISNIKIKNMNFCGKILKAEDKNNSLICCNKAGSFFDELTIE